MHLSTRALAIVGAILWGGSILFSGLLNLLIPGYGLHFLQLISSVYPGFHAAGTLGDLLVGTIYGMVDGGIGGFVFGWLYNFLVNCCQSKRES